MKTMKWIVMIVAFLALGAVGAFAQDRQPAGGQGGKTPSPKEWVTHLDKDEDGQVSKDEFDGPAEHFARFDRNGDGYITEDEAPQGPPPGQQGQGGPGGMSPDERRTP